MSEYYFHNGTGSRNLRPCQYLKYDPQRHQAIIQPSGWSAGKYLIVEYVSVFHKDSPHIIWTQTKNHKPRPEIRAKHFAEMELADV